MDGRWSGGAVRGGGATLHPPFTRQLLNRDEHREHEDDGGGEDGILTSPTDHLPVEALEGHVAAGEGAVTSAVVDVAAVDLSMDGHRSDPSMGRLLRPAVGKEVEPQGGTGNCVADQLAVTDRADDCTTIPKVLLWLSAPRE